MVSPSVNICCILCFAVFWTSGTKLETSSLEMEDMYELQRVNASAFIVKLKHKNKEKSTLDSAASWFFSPEIQRRVSFHNIKNRKAKSAFMHKRQTKYFDRATGGVISKRNTDFDKNYLEESITEAKTGLPRRRQMPIEKYYPKFEEYYASILKKDSNSSVSNKEDRFRSVTSLLKNKTANVLLNNSSSITEDTPLRLTIAPAQILTVSDNKFSVVPTTTERDTLVASGSDDLILTEVTNGARSFTVSESNDRDNVTHLEIGISNYEFFNSGNLTSTVLIPIEEKSHTMERDGGFRSYEPFSTPENISTESSESIFTEFTNYLTKSFTELKNIDEENVTGSEIVESEKPGFDVAYYDENETSVPISSSTKGGMLATKGESVNFFQTFFSTPMYTDFISNKNTTEKAQTFPTVNFLNDRRTDTVADTVSVDGVTADSSQLFSEFTSFADDVTTPRGENSIVTEYASIVHFPVSSRTIFENETTRSTEEKENVMTEKNFQIITNFSSLDGELTSFSPINSSLFTLADTTLPPRTLFKLKINRTEYKTTRIPEYERTSNTHSTEYDANYKIKNESTVESTLSEVKIVSIHQREYTIFLIGIVLCSFGVVIIIAGVLVLYFYNRKKKSSASNGIEMRSSYKFDDV